MSIIIARCGFNRHTHRAIIYGPSEYGGAGFKRLYDQQGIGQIKGVVRHWRANTPTGFLLRNLVEWVNYSLGMPRCFLEDVHTDLPHMESKWLGSLRQYLKSNDLWIVLDSSGIPPLERVHDSYIMDSIIRSKLFTRTQIRRLNYCRLYLNALMLSDLTTVVGDRLDPDKLKGSTSLFSTHNRWMCINQERPSELEWRLWRRANKIWSDLMGVMMQTLGRWTQPHSKRRIRCMAYQYGTTLAVYKDGHNYTKCHLNTGREYINDPSRSIHYDDIPEHANPVMVILNTDATWKVTKVTQTIRTSPPITYGTFSEYIATLNPWEMDLLHHHELSTACLELQSHFFAGSDGSEKYGVQGAFGWVISTAKGERLAFGMGPARGRRMDSYRAECTGILSILRFLFRIEQYTAAHEPIQGVIGTDSQSLLDKLNPSRTAVPRAAVPIKLDELSSEWDLLIKIQEGLRLLPGVSVTYVRGHQDDKRPYDRLPLLAQLNVDADKHAGQYQNQHGTPRPFVLMTARTGAHLVHSSGTITSQYEDSIRIMAVGPTLQHQIQTKYEWSEGVMRSINWKAHGRAFRSHKASKVHFSKLVHDCLPTHSLLNKFDSGSRRCPKCNHTDESRDHILQCPHASRRTWRERWWKEIEKFHESANTSPVLRHVFRVAITQWFHDQQSIILNPDLFPLATRQLIHQQNRIGWRHIFNGRFSSEWARLQGDYYHNHRNHTKYRRTGMQWQHNLITSIWKMWLQLWTMRNADVHGHTLRAQEAAERQTLTRALTVIYDNRQHMESPIQQLLHSDVNTHMQRPGWVIRNWLSMNTPLIRESLRRVRDNSRRGVRSIKSYFRPAPVG